jgi:hypothetical protein
LDRHLESQDLSELAKRQNVVEEIKNWPEPFREDHQVVTAYSYLKGWALFNPTKG